MGKIKVIKETDKGKEGMIIITLPDWIIQSIGICFALLEFAFAFILIAFGITIFCLVTYTIIDYFQL